MRKVTKINISTSIFEQKELNRSIQEYPWKFLKNIPGSNKRLKYNYKHTIRKKQELNDLCSIEALNNTDIKNQLKTKDTSQNILDERNIKSERNNQIIKKNSIQQNSLYKNFQKQKRQNISGQNDIYRLRAKPHQFNFLDNMKITKKSSLRRSLSISRTIENDERIQATSRNEFYKNDKKNQFSLPNKQLNPYTNQEYIYARNLKNDEYKRKKGIIDVKRQSSILKSYKIISVELSNPREKFSKKFISNKNINISNFYLDASDQNLKQIVEQDKLKLKLNYCNKQPKRGTSSQSSKTKGASHLKMTKNMIKEEDLSPSPWEQKKEEDLIFNQ